MKCLLAIMFIVAAPSAFAHTVTVRVIGIKEAVGQINVALCNGGFDEKGCPWGGLKPALVPEMSMIFPNIPSGSYAVAVYQDEDGSGDITKNMLGLPKEPYGFSNDVGRLGPPSFSGALVDVQGDTTIEVRVKRLFDGS